MHVRNKHRSYLDYRELARKQPLLEPFVFVNAWGNASIDYADPEALEELTRSLLREFYDLTLGPRGLAQEVLRQIFQKKNMAV